MAFDPIPLAVKGGIHSEQVLRMVAHRAAQGAEGVSGIGDLMVRQQSVASGKVDIAVGGATLLNRYPGVINESYVGRASTLTSIDIAPNASGATRYDLVIARIDDWNFAGQQAVPAALPTDSVPVFKPAVLSGVAAGTTSPIGLAGVNYPAIPLARIAIPAGTSAITNAMITDLRQLVNPRRQRLLLTKGIITGQESTLSTTSAAGQKWPWSWTGDIPEWAARVRVIWGVRGARIASGQAYGPTWVKMGVGDPAVYSSQTVYWDTGNANNVVRLDIGGSDDMYVPAALRGKKSAVFEIWGSVAAGSQATAYPKADASSSTFIDLEFLEAPAQDA